MRSWVAKKISKRWGWNIFIRDKLNEIYYSVWTNFWPFRLISISALFEVNNIYQIVMLSSLRSNWLILEIYGSYLYLASALQTKLARYLMLSIFNSLDFQREVPLMLSRTNSRNTITIQAKQQGFQKMKGFLPSMIWILPKKSSIALK